MTTAPVLEDRSAIVMPIAPRRRRVRVRGLLNLAGALLVSAAVLYAAFFPTGPLPALGPAFNPATGAWTMAADAQVTDRTLSLAGLEQPVQVVFESNGTAHITAQTDHDLFVATGYVQARFRLFQMDLMRRQGAGRLSEIVGKAALDTDTFELQLGLLRTAHAEWNALSADDPLRQILIAYSQGVNDRIQEAESTHHLDAMFTLLGYQPKPWTPIDSLLIKGDMTQTLNFTDTPIVMALLNKSLGADLTSAWFPILPPNVQSPYDPGPYKKAAPAPIQTAPAATAAATAGSESAADLYANLAALPQGLIAHGGESNNWAVAGAKSVSGGALLAGDPHLHLTLPAIWFQMTQDSPSYHSSGVAIPGTPGVLLGHNQHIAWSLTDAQNQQTFFYVEKEDSAHPGMYLWKGTWTPYTTVGYDIPVLGEATRRLSVKLSVHGPVISDRGQTTTVWWAGSIPSQDLAVLMGINRASDWTEFRDALRGWYSPTHNFVYADDKGNIGLISAGYYPQVPANAQPWLPMPGTGEFDVTGTIPYDDIPQAYDPPDNIIWSANQRQVTANYPYYIGTASNFFDPGYRANEIHRALSRPGKLSAADMQALQTDTRDFLASEMVPELLTALNGEPLTAQESADVALLKSWDYRMDADSKAATVWWFFWQEYMNQTFSPWWTSRHVKVSMNEVSDALGQDLESWTLNDPNNGAFSAPGVGARDATQAMRQAFKSVVAKLSSKHMNVAWGSVHGRVLDNLAQIAGLSYGPRADRGDGNTPLAAPDLPSDHGPSWRMVVDWGSQTFQGVYPGGSSENPASSWYTNRVDTWWNGQLDPMLSADQAASAAGIRTWTLHP